MTTRGRTGMTGRQSVPGLKGASHVRSFTGPLACSFIPVLLSGFRGVRGAIGETCSSTPWWPLLLGLGVFRVYGDHLRLPIRFLTRRGSQISRSWLCRPGKGNKGPGRRPKGRSSNRRGQSRCELIRWRVQSRWERTPRKNQRGWSTQLRLTHRPLPYGCN